MAITKGNFLKRVKNMQIPITSIPDRKLDEEQVCLLEVNEEGKKPKKPFEKGTNIVHPYTTETEFYTYWLRKALNLAYATGAERIKIHTRHSHPLMLEWHGSVTRRKHEQKIHCRYWLAPLYSDNSPTEDQLLNAIILDKL